MDPDKTQKLTGTEAQAAQAPQQEPGQEPGQPEPRQPQVGDTLLLHVGPGVSRPLIACTIGPLTHAVTGLLIFAGEEDRHLPWVQRFCKSLPSSANPSCWVTAYQGWELGEWHFPGEREEGAGR
jgi:hypothetical protein